MKTDRLLSVVLYLLNHDTASAAQLAAKFEVSRRTVMRDMEQLSMAGIPIRSTPGVNGGYSIMEGYKLDGRLVTAGDRAAMATALRGFLSAYDGKRYGDLLEKLASIAPEKPVQTVFYDFGASGENDEIQGKLKSLENAIHARTAVRIRYIDASGRTSDRLIEPVALSYRWYAWYLAAYCTEKQAYRIFKLVRIAGLEPMKTAFSKAHGDPAAVLEQAFQSGGRRSMDVTVLVRAKVKTQAREYLGGTVERTLDNGDIILKLPVWEEERMWFAMLLSFGDQVTVLAPEKLKTRMAETAERILSAYPKR